MTAWTTPATWTAGQTVSATDLNTQVRDNENHLAEQISRAAWTSFTPTYSQITVGNGTNTGYKGYAGKTTFLRVEFTLGSTSSVGSDPQLNFPDTAITQLQLLPIGQVILVDSGTANYKGLLIFNNTSQAVIYVENASGTYTTYSSITATVPFTWTTGDKILITARYERA